MLYKTFGPTVNVFATLLCFVAILSTAAPLGRLPDTLAKRELVPIIPGTQIQPPLVDLLDQFQNLQKQFDAGTYNSILGTIDICSTSARSATASPDDPNFNLLSQQLNDTKAKLDAGIKGIAVLVTSNAAASPDSAPTTTTGAETVSTTSPPKSVITDVPVVTVVTQVGTSFVVIASQGVTSTVTLATITGVRSGPVSSPTGSVASRPPKSSATVLGTAASMTATRVATTGTAANSSAQQTAGAKALAPKSIAATVLASSLFGAMMALL